MITMRNDVSTLADAAKRYTKHQEQFRKFRDTFDAVAQTFPTLEVGKVEDNGFTVKFTGYEWLVRHQYDLTNARSNITGLSVVRLPGAVPEYTNTARTITMDSSGNLKINDHNAEHTGDDEGVPVVMFHLLGLIDLNA